MIIVGPHWIGVVATVAILSVSTGMFIKQQCTTLPWYYTLITMSFFSTTLYYLYQTACKDPGIVQRDASNTQDAAQDELECSRSDTSADSTLRAMHTYSSQRSTVTCYCDICGIQQGFYTEHCDDCGVCIAEYDHHCPWMGKCIGRDNMRAFKLFNVSWVLYVVFVVYVAVLHVEWGDIAVQRLQRMPNGSWQRVPSQP